jgi:hypothetical protein
MRKITTEVSGVALVLLAGLASGQTSVPVNAEVSSASGSAEATMVVEMPLAARNATSVRAPNLAPELALQVYGRRTALQDQQLGGYTDVTVIHAELPDVYQKGEYELQRHYAAPGTLKFVPVHYTGDGFVKTNVIVRLLQVEEDRLQNRETSPTAITGANYKFAYAGQSDIDGRLVHAYDVKPRAKRKGLFKGRMYLDPVTGSLVRTEGVLTKSSSFFIKKVRFVNDYADIGTFTLPVRLHVVVLARIIGHAVVDVYHRNYQAIPVARSSEGKELVAPWSAVAATDRADSSAADYFDQEHNK